MKINLFESIKTRIFDELEDSIGRNSAYKDKVKVYHKFPYKERVSSGVVLKNASFNRLKLSPDDFIGHLKSHFASARAGNNPGEFLDWVWEDTNNMVNRSEDDVSSQVDGSTREFQVDNFPITAGPGNTELAYNFRQVDVFINGVRTYAEDVYPEEGKVRLYSAPPAGAEVKLGYYYKTIASPGRYYLEIVQDGAELKYVVNPLYSVEEEIVIENARGNELGGNLQNQNIMVDQVMLFMRKPGTDYSIRLIQDEEYEVNIDGEITFIGSFSMEPRTNLVAYYRWVGEEIGPRDIPKDKRYDNEAIKGVSLCFNDKVNLGDKAVVICYPSREMAARVYGGHFMVNLDIEVFTMDTVQLPGMVDHIVNDIWNHRRIPLISEGITIEELDSSGETEEVYDENTGDLYYKNSLSMTIMTEWKRFVPVLFELIDYKISLSTLTIQSNKYVKIYQNRIVSMDTRLSPKTEPFEVSVVKPGYPRIS
jgi:hypothetical protein